MPLAAVIMVLVSCVSHAYWNLLAKQARDKLVFCWLLYATGGIVMIPLAIWGARAEPIQPAMWWCALGTSLAFTAYSVLLARSYRHGDVSLVYPLVRSTGPLLTVVLAHTFLHERLSPFGYMGILLIVLGAGGIGWPRREAGADGATLHARRLQVASILPAILTGATIAIFSSIDKEGVTLANPMFYNFTLFWGTVLFMGPLVLQRRSWEQVVAEVRVDWRPLWVTGTLNVFGYLLVLYAMRLAAASYVIALRSTAVVFAIFLGSRVLGEKRGLQRGLLGLLIVAGLALVYLKG